MLDPEVYFRLFQVDPAGKQVLEELATFHYDIQSFDDNPHKTSYNEGRRAVVRWIMMKIALAQRPDTDTLIIEE